MTIYDDSPVILGQIDGYARLDHLMTWPGAWPSSNGSKPLRPLATRHARRWSRSPVGTGRGHEPAGR
jgi:hypothetical protein